MKKTNFDCYLAEQMEDPAFAARFKQAGEAWDVALQVVSWRNEFHKSPTSILVWGSRELINSNTYALPQTVDELFA